MHFLRRKYILANKEEKANHVSDTISLLDRIGKMSPTDAVKFILKEIYIIETESISDRLLVYSFLSACDLFETIPGFVSELRSIIAIEKKSEEEDSPDISDDSGAVATGGKPLITLSSMHSSKGREFDRVIIVD